MPYNTDSCPTRRAPSHDAFCDEMDVPGVFFLEEERGWLWVVLPNGHHAALPIRGRATENPLPSGAWWALSGTPDAPTLTPSINQHPVDEAGIPGWHGFLTDGRLVSC